MTIHVGSERKASEPYLAIHVGAERKTSEPYLAIHVRFEEFAVRLI